MDLIAIVSSAPAAASATSNAGIIVLSLIPFIIVGCVVGTVYLLRRRQKRRMWDV